MLIKNFRVLKLDSYNLTFEEYRKVESTRKGVTTSTTKWVRVGGYYGKVSQCLEAMKNYIISTYMNLEDYQEVLDMINALNGAVVECKIVLHIPDDDL